MGRKPNAPLSNLATSSSPNNFSYENTKQPCSDRNNLTKAPVPAEIMHDLQRWSEDEVLFKRRTNLPTTLQLAKTSPPQQQQQTSGAKTIGGIDINKDKLNV